jgi:hypothetical protein
VGYFISDDHSSQEAGAACACRRPFGQALESQMGLVQNQADQPARRTSRRTGVITEESEIRI